MEEKRSLLDRIADWLDDKPTEPKSTEPELSPLQQVELMEFERLLIEYARPPNIYFTCVSYQDQAENIYSFVRASTLPEETTKRKIDQLIAKIILEKPKGEGVGDCTYSAVKALSDCFKPELIEQGKKKLVPLTLEGAVRQTPQIRYTDISSLTGSYSDMAAVDLVLEGDSGEFYQTYLFIPEQHHSLLCAYVTVLTKAKKDKSRVRVEVKKGNGCVKDFYEVISDYQIIREKKPSRL